METAHTVTTTHNPRGPEFSGFKLEQFEPTVGQISAVRTFRIGPGGLLYPLHCRQVWRPGVNRAVCFRLAAAFSQDHVAPEGECTCGFYAYSHADWAAEQPYARYVLAVVTCWGRVVAGTRGLRCQHARIEAIWLSRSVPSELADSIHRNYPKLRIYRNRRLMLTRHPLDVLDVYDPPPLSKRRARLAWAAACTGTLCGAAPELWLDDVPFSMLLYSLVALACIATITLPGRTARQRPRNLQRDLLGLAITLWMIAPVAGTAGFVLLRLPLLQIAALAVRHRVRVRRFAGTFPAVIRS